MLRVEKSLPTKPKWRKTKVAQIFWRKKPRARRQGPDAKSQMPRARCQEPDAKSQTPRARRQEPDAKSQTPRTRRQEPDAESQTPRTRYQEPDAKSPMPKLHGTEIWEKPNSNGTSLESTLNFKLSLLTIFWCHSEQLIIFWKTAIAITRRVSRNLLNYGTQHSWFEYRIIQTKIH